MSVNADKVIPLREQRRNSIEPGGGKASLFQGVKVERPPCPEWLSGVAKEHFEFLVDELEKSGLVAKIDMGALAIMAEHWRGLVEAKKQIILDGGELQETPNGYMQLSPASVLFARHSADYEKLAKQFGVTVRARQSIKIDNPDQGNLDL